jgi:hypothetical protein
MYLNRCPCAHTLCVGSPVFSWHCSQLQSMTLIAIWRTAFGQTNRSQRGSGAAGAM